MHSPVVSIVVPCYNQAQYLSDALNSVLAQKYTKWECIIINDGSQDHTEQVALYFCSLDSRFKYFSKENEDVSAARNDGIAKAVGKYILPLDGDDKISPDYIQEAVKILDKDDAIKLVYCKAELFGSQIGPWNLTEFTLAKLVMYNIIFVSALFRKKDWEAVGGFDTNINGAEDWEFWIAILKDGGGVVCLPFVGFFYRKKESSKYLSLTDNDRNAHISYVYKKHAALVIELFGDPVALNYKIESLQYENKALKSFYSRIMSNPFFRHYIKFKQHYSLLKKKL